MPINCMFIGGPRHARVTEVPDRNVRHFQVVARDASGAPLGGPLQYQYVIYRSTEYVYFGGICHVFFPCGEDRAAWEDDTHRLVSAYYDRITFWDRNGGGVSNGAHAPYRPATATWIAGDYDEVGGQGGGWSAPLQRGRPAPLPPAQTEEEFGAPEPPRREQTGGPRTGFIDDPPESSSGP